MIEDIDGMVVCSRRWPGLRAGTNRAGIAARGNQSLPIDRILSPLSEKLRSEAIAAARQKSRKASAQFRTNFRSKGEKKIRTPNKCAANPKSPAYSM
jgi:hypothetical protein